MLEFARGLQILPTPKGENVVIVTGAGALACCSPMPVWTMACAS